MKRTYILIFVCIVLIYFGVRRNINKNKRKNIIITYGRVKKYDIINEKSMPECVINYIYNIYDRHY